jgi:hypothetical protein
LLIAHCSLFIVKGHRPGDGLSSILEPRKGN